MIKSEPTVRSIDPYRLWIPPRYAQVASTTSPSRIIAIAGQIAVDAHGNTPSTLAEQIPLALKNLHQALESAGATVQDILRLTYYFVKYDPNDATRVEPLANFLQGHRPASTLVPVPCLARPNLLFEVEATATIPVQPTRSVDVVVVGAGLSGLQAASGVQNAGLSCTVVEARDRVGGKTWSRDFDGVKADVGAAWINDTNQSRMWAMVKRFGLNVVKQNTQGGVVLEDVKGNVQVFPYGSVPAESDAEEGGVANMVYIRDLVERLCQRIDIAKPAVSGKVLGKDYDTMTLAEFVTSEGGGVTAVGTASVWTRAMLGLEPSEVSALYFLNYCKSGGGLMQMRSDGKDGGQYLRIVEGTQAFSRNLAASLKPDSILINSPVRTITQTESGIHVSSARGDFLCKRLILSIPTPLYREITFTPPLPTSKVALSTSTKLGTYAKLILAYSAPWWRSADLCGLSQSPIGPFCVTRDTSIDAACHYALTCFLCGEPSREWNRLSSAEARKEAVLAQLQRMYEPFVPGGRIPSPKDVIEQQWIEEQWTQGCPCPALPPGGLTEFGDVLREPVGCMHFVGTETAFEWKGYMEGAVRSGERGAAEVVAALGNKKQFAKL